MQRAGSSNASTKVRNDFQRPVSRFSSVTSATPAKRITFFKSGDAQFSGVRMAIHKRSFKCFDALLDDLSQKVPLPFGVRTITTPRGTHSIQRLEQLEDGGCYICSDRRYVRPIDVEAAGKRPAVWHHSHPHNSRKKPSRPEEPPTGHSGLHYHRHPKRIVLVKNSDPAVRRSIILSRRTARSLRVFMDEISELMQCHVRKLYTLDGRKIDSIQSLMQCPSVLVCVGRESFKPLLLENLRKHSEEKLPGMGTRSHSSICSEGHESKKNVNFGLETKKSIIHPRSDSSNRSTRFSLSSEKSYTNGLCMTPGQSGCVSTCPYTKDIILNDDIEKRVLVNKDGSLSVEMKVRFRLVNDETLQWSTEIKKSATTLNESSSVKDGEAHYLQGKAENSDPESNSACEAEETCAPKLHQKHVEESHCQNCCNHCQEYDIWKNPMHKDSRDNGGRKSSSSSVSSHTIMHKKASVDSVRTISRSSEEYTERVVEKALCFQKTVEEGDTRVEYCSISRCCSRSETSEVINDWLKNIPVDGPLYEMEDEFNEEHNEAVPQIVTVNEEDEESSQKEIGEIAENVMKMKDSQEIEWAEGGDPIKEDNSVICNEIQACNETSEINAANTDPSPPRKFTKKEGLPKRCHSSVQVMKVLLSPKLDRCNSLPEVSPVYGRRLSTSAKGLLDCLANLQLIDSDPKNGKEDKYNEIISILQSLWISQPSESEQDKHNIKDQCSAEDEFNPRSSSGVDVSSGSIGSINGGVEKSETADRTAPVIEQEALQVQVDTVKEGKDDPSSTTPESTDTSHIPSDPLTPDIAERVRCSPEDEKPEEELPIDEDSHAREETTQSNENQKEFTEAELSNTSSENASNDLKSPTDKETDSPENDNSGMPTSAQRGILTRKVSQDPDPVWVLSLLKKLEKQFMSHYANAVAEFKVKWDLDDSEMLDKMISELKEEVQKRIQSSINRELQKIQSRAGRPPRPPIKAVSRDSTVQTEQRRRRLKVMRDKSINPSVSRSEDMNTASGTEFSDQRSEDEYCPCDTCLKKKMASRAVQRAEALSLAPVLKDFDLRKILQKKKDPPATMATESQLEGQKNLKEATNCSDVQNNLDVVHEESEVHHDVKGQTDTVEVEGTTYSTQTKYENSEEDASLASKNQDVDAGLVNDRRLGEEEGLFDDGNKAEKENSAEDGKIEKEEDRAEEGETEIERAEEENVQEEKEHDDKGEEEENKEASVAVDGDAEDADDREAATEEDQPEKEATYIEEMGNSEDGDEGETAKEEAGEEARAAEEEEVEDIEEKIETAEEDEVTEDGKGKETESAHESVESENIKVAENEMAETTEGDTTNKDEGGAPEEDDGERNQRASSQAEDEADEDQTETNPDQAKNEQEEQQVPSLTASEEVEVQAEGEDCGSDEKHENDTEAKSTDEAENQDNEKGAEIKKDNSVEGLTEQFKSNGTEAYMSGQACSENSGHRLIKQITKTSVESQPGSMENATDQKVQAKLKDIRSFMESLESQEDSIVVITKQSPFTERRNVSSRPGNKEEVGNEVIEWQVSPKRRNRSPARANKQRRPKDSEVKVDDLEF
ncbi:hypothetical protein AOLI_G00121560 [Acnodon oligacanthus]